MTLDYFYGQVGELFSFYRIPKALFLESRFQNLSTDAKTLYGILLDRMSLSAKNGWLDEQGRVFIIFTIRTIRSEEITIDVRICAALAANRGSGEVYLAAIAPDMELTIITLDEAPGILPCFEEDDACLNLPDTSLLLCYNPAQVLKMGGKHYLTGPVILARTNMDGRVISLTIDEVYLFQKYLESHSITLMADDQKLPCICID